MIFEKSTRAEFVLLFFFLKSSRFVSALKSHHFSIDYSALEMYTRSSPAYYVFQVQVRSTNVSGFFTAYKKRFWYSAYSQITSLGCKGTWESLILATPMSIIITQPALSPVSFSKRGGREVFVSSFRSYWWGRLGGRICTCACCETVKMYVFFLVRKHPPSASWCYCIAVLHSTNINGYIFRCNARRVEFWWWPLDCLCPR